MWTSSSRRSHEQSRTSSPGAESADSHRRTSSEATPRPTPATPRYLQSATDHDSPAKGLLSVTSSDVHGSSKRLAFFADKLSSSLSGTGSSHVKSQPSQLLHPHSHSRANSNSASPASASPSPAPMASSSSISNAAKSHASPSKSSYGRTYDSKLVTREMHRLNLAHLPSALAPQPSTAPSVSSLALPTPAGMSQINVSSTTTDPWSALHVYLLPLFNGERLKVDIEDLNGLVKGHISTTVSSSPSRALVNLENDASELIASGMVTLNAKLMNVDDEKLVSRVVETWGFFWDQILTYVEGALLPMQTDPLLSSLSRTTKTHPRGSSPSRQNTQSSISTQNLTTPSIDVRTIALRAFRDRVVYPLFPRLQSRLSLPNRQDVFQETGTYQRPRLQQMLLVLSAQGRQRPMTFSLTAPAPQPTPGEGAVSELLRLVRNPHPHFDARHQRSSSFHSRTTPSFLSEGLPRDRRGRIAGKTINGIPHNFHIPGTAEDYEVGDDATAWSYAAEIDREKDRITLDSLRSPDPEGSATKTSFGGPSTTSASAAPLEYVNDDLPDLDQAQADLEKYMATMNSYAVDPRRK